MGSSCELVIFISISASSISKGKTKEEIDLLAAFFVQLGDTLASISLLDNSQN